MKAATTDGSFAMVTYRLMQASQRIGLTPLAMIFNKLNVIFGGCIIGRGADFGCGFVLIQGKNGSKTSLLEPLREATGADKQVDGRGFPRLPRVINGVPPVRRAEPSEVACATVGLSCLANVTAV